MSCEEWFGRLRRSISGSTPPRVAGELPLGPLDRRRPDLVTVEDFHRECVIIVTRIVSSRERG